MFLLIASALAGTQIGWPCQRLNWGWRNVWSTCSINSFVPHATNDDAVAKAPQFYRFSSLLTLAPVQSLNGAGIYTPTANVPSLAIPQQLCTNALATGTGATANLRNRCRRAIDAYGALVTTCKAPISATGAFGSNTYSPDHAPASHHQPHVSNVQGLTHNAQMCLFPAGQYYVPNLATPSTTCPGLLGWFTVVYNACHFTRAPGIATVANYFPLGATTNVANVLNSQPVSPANKAGYFCKNTVGGTAATSTPDGWNDASPFGASVPAGASNFRTSRCRKALDQFGRTAQRCAQSTASLSGPAQAGGYSDVLRLLAVGTGGANAPLGMNIWAPACN